MRPEKFLRGLPRVAFSFLALCLLALASVGCGKSDAATDSNSTPAAHDKKAAEPQGILVEAAEVSIAPMSALYSTSATLAASQQATITARTRGVIERLMVEEGESVRAGQPMAELENAEQEIAAERTRAGLETVRREFERTQSLFEQELVSEEIFETVRRNLSDAQQSAALADLELSRTIIRAPFGGVVLRRHLDVGNTVSDGTAVYQVADTDELWAEVNVPERQIARLQLGQNVQLTADATQGQVQAEIERIAPRVDTDTGTVRVTVAVDGPTATEQGLRPGSFVRVDIVTDTRPEALVVPREALLAEGRRWVVYRVGQDSQSVEQVEIRIGFENSQLVEIAEIVDPDQEPLKIGERIVTAGVGALSDGAAIEIAETKPTNAAEGDTASEVATDVGA